ncbi:FUSC family protein [Methylobacterium nonmethylotrophicum]|uniref:Fusaric acid resistance protein n=1 Tax=Methylobacterium nonmethylotrophicum TaxID=1141884 RepID=A0A4Z0NNZ1_9HYPH|nr:FUSC family protein [Methylobacterium nonmethylotrophicum]TGD97744.1 hypothetical protein EU555_19155 [Methylobacterium nonmethylotrophicum]
MPIPDLSAAAPLLPGRPAARYPLRDLRPLAFGLRTALAALAALWLAMWLQLDNPRWAAWTVMAIALPTRGEVKRKGAWRLGGTLLGLLAGLIGTACFAQSSVGAGLYLAAWTALAATIGGRLPGFGAYGTALAGLTASLIMLETAGAPLSAFDLALERGSNIGLGIACAYLASVAAEALHGAAAPATPPPPPAPPAAVIAANAARLVLLVGSAWLLWFVTAWPSGPIFIILAVSLGLNFTTLPNVERGTWPCLWGVALGQAAGLALKFGPLTSTPSFGLLAATLIPCLTIGAVGATDRRSAVLALGFNVSFLLAAAPQNPMQYDLGASLNEAVAVVAGVALVVAAYRYLWPRHLWRHP